MHHIQKSIILHLAHTSPLRFTDLQPPRTPNNAFSYHLKKLLDSGYIEPTKGGYVATRKALKLVVYGVSNGRSQPAPTVLSTIYIENLEGEVLLINRNHKPFQGWYGLPSGLIHKGEALEEAAHRELYEKTGLATDGPLQAVGVLDIRYVEEGTGDIFMHALAFVYRHVFTGDKRLLEDETNHYGQLTWSKLRRSHILSEVTAVKRLVDRGTFCHESVTFVEPSQLPTIVLAPEHSG